MAPKTSKQRSSAKANDILRERRVISTPSTTASPPSSPPTSSSLLLTVSSSLSSNGACFSDAGSGKTGHNGISSRNHDDISAEPRSLSLQSRTDDLIVVSDVGMKCRSSASSPATRISGALDDIRGKLGALSPDRHDGSPIPHSHPLSRGHGDESLGSGVGMTRRSGAAPLVARATCRTDHISLSDRHDASASQRSFSMSLRSDEQSFDTDVSMTSHSIASPTVRHIWHISATYHTYICHISYIYLPHIIDISSTYIESYITYIVYRISHIIYHISIPHISYIIYHISYLIYHISYIFI
jgi:hypothetical protein